jgi:hypothetical protein
MSLLHALFSHLNTKEEGGTHYLTLQGEKVKSKAEKIIADYFYENGINYEYEQLTKTAGWPFKKKVSRPDFHLPDYGVYVEYWNLIDADGERKRSEYRCTMRWKMAQYRKNRIKFVSIYPSNLCNLDRIFRAKFSEATGIDLPIRAGACEQARINNEVLIRVN